MQSKLNKLNKKLQARYNYLTLLEYNGNRSISKFLDKDFGEFSAVYHSVYSSGTMHPKRRKIQREKKYKQTMIDRYGVENPFQSEEVKEKIKQTNLKKYGSINPQKNKNIREKTKKTNLKKYGTEYGFQNENVKEKIKQTNLKRYGVEYPQENKDIKNKQRQTMVKRYGNEHALKNQHIVNKLKKNNLKKYGVEYPAILKEIWKKGIKTKINKGVVYNINCHTASEFHKNNNYDFSITTFYRAIKESGIESAILYETNKTNIENIISIILNKHKLNFKFNKLLKSIKPDFLLTDYNLIIECDGLYFHSDGCKYRKDIIENKNWHKERQEKYKELGYSSLFFREDEIINKTHIVESIILAKLGLISNRIYARKTTIKEVGSKISSKFFEENHLMGRGTGKCFALFYNDEIVSAIRIVNKKNYLDVSRFCNRLNTSVAGGLSKLLKHIIKEYNPNKIVSFVDMRYGDGSSLKKIGFVAKTNYVSFKWCKGIQTFHRMAFPKNSGYEVGLSKIWDCGQKKFELIV